MEQAFRESHPPPGGFPPFPWDHVYLSHPDGREARVAVDLDGTPMMDAHGDLVMTGPGFGHRPVKAEFMQRTPSPDLETEDLTPDGRSIVDRAYEVSRDHGHPWVGTEHLVLAILLEDPALGERFALPPVAEVEAGVARFYDGPAWEARLERVAARREGRLPRTPSNGPSWNMALANTVRGAVGLARSSGSRAAGPLHLLVADLRTGRSFVVLRLQQEGRDVGEIVRRAKSTTEWLPLITAVDEAGGTDP
ncbi:MAG TPA: Clp protease N-terminal domain-containing protein [Actinomycetota bacterium]|nr:Clp protease N-terminal domain-containing protein [Actinomycetota bacterium]